MFIADAAATNAREWAFPAKTCELSVSLAPAAPAAPWRPAQPWSFAVNFATTAVLLYYLFCRAKRWYVRTAIASFVLFEGFHTFSHAVHLSSVTAQTNTIHCIAYVFFGSTYVCLRGLTKHDISPRAKTAIVLFIGGDLFVFFNYTGIWSVLTGLTLFPTLFVAFWPRFSPWFARRVKIMFVGLLVLFVLLYNEARNCKAMLEYSGAYPYHAAIEVAGFALFVYLADSLCGYEKKHNK